MVKIDSQISLYLPLCFSEPIFDTVLELKVKILTRFVDRQVSTLHLQLYCSGQYPIFLNRAKCFDVGFGNLYNQLLMSVKFPVVSTVVTVIFFGVSSLKKLDFLTFLVPKINYINLKIKMDKNNFFKLEKYKSHKFLKQTLFVFEHFC